MTDRDKLIELIRQGKDMTPCENNSNYNCKGIKCEDCESQSIADYLLANGVTVLPLPIGSTVYEIRARGIRRMITSRRKCDYSIVNDMYFKNAKEYNLEFYVKAKKFVKYDKTRWNKTVFATKEEAEAELEKRGKVNA